ncbi:MAG TPA: serine/threonine-protein kinase [Longimicrobiales bacterium]|nr:serine/threonine-protein kinase [Longimicrobiales bacterium]
MSSNLDEALAAALAPDLEVQRVLGQGATSRVYLARDVALDKPVTLKVLKQEAAASPEARARFEREARAAAHILHPNVVAVYRFGVLPDGEPYVVMQYVRGRSLEERIAAEGALGVAETRRILCDVASALDAAHARGVVHRDVRPGNILLDEDGERALVTDFGIAALTEAWRHERGARLTATGQLLGDPHYVSPEQYRGEPVTDATDIYSMALVGYEMLTGKMPHADAGARAAAVARLTAEPVEIPISLMNEDRGLADLLTRCLVADPARRPRARSITRRLDRRAQSGPSRDAGDSPPLLPAQLHTAWHALYRKRVPQWITGATAGGWLLLEAVSQAIEMGVLPDVLYLITLPSVFAAIVAAAVLAWFHGERGDQRARPAEVWLLLGIVVLWIASLVAILP